MAAKDLTAARVRELLNYDEATGLLSWRVRRGSRAPAGAKAGSINAAGYLVVWVDGGCHRAHRLAWLHAYGAWPKDDVDHMDGDRTNNRIGNLRDVDRSTNLQNLRAPVRPSKSGLLGVAWFPRDLKWSARIRVDGKRRHLGYFLTKELAHGAYLEAKRKLHAGCTI